MLSAIVMASGFSSRMGTNKLLLPYKGKAMIEHILDELPGCGFGSIILAAQDKTILDMGSARGIRSVHNMRASEGQSESIRLGIVNSPECSGYAFFTGDQPYMDSSTIKYLMKAFDETGDKIIIPICKGKRGTPVIFPSRFRQELLELSGDSGGRQVINRHSEDVRFVEIGDETLLWDIDTKEDYKKLLSMNNK
jgi:molybdenum cofactor cytidylyltransferase